MTCSLHKQIKIYIYTDWFISKTVNDIHRCRIQKWNQMGYIYISFPLFNVTVICLLGSWSPWVNLKSYSLWWVAPFLETLRDILHTSRMKFLWFSRGWAMSGWLGRDGRSLFFLRTTGGPASILFSISLCSPPVIISNFWSNAYPLPRIQESLDNNNNNQYTLLIPVGN